LIPVQKQPQCRCGFSCSMRRLQDQDLPVLNEGAGVQHAESMARGKIVEDGIQQDLAEQPRLLRKT